MSRDVVFDENVFPFSSLIFIQMQELASVPKLISFPLLFLILVLFILREKFLLII
jgi:ABC-type anion transport system duplicated permease subunit